MFEEFEMARIFNGVLGDKTVFFRDDMTAVMDTQPELYSKYLAGQVSRYMVAALKDKEEILGYLIADNYSLEKQIETVRAMETIAMFVGTQLKNQLLKDELVFLGSHDALTGLGNRHALNKAIISLSSQTSPVGICYTDINGLKLINDEKGHEAGDQIIIDIGMMFGSIFKKKYCYRIGGDEFVAIVPDIEKEKFEELIAKILLKNSKEVSLSVGYAWSKSSKGINDLIKKADEAMYREKASFL
ncbi:GGDEF domain-containing protein [Butyrivibrio sp. FCS014]|uniref:GGDEF domain-containing protein n=1 Tax=Butyrivibrio sp. FCS014 TaxID=1408304 RepID=UPI001FA6E1C6|nr:GGDEF domain-containing protein [Butyrivibrio sp. FCS014]